jgi:prepilin-type processing-associated H-X9-DG protein
MRIKAKWHKLLATYHNKMLQIAFVDGNTRAFALHMEHYLSHNEKYKNITGVDLDVY